MRRTGVGQQRSERPVVRRLHRRHGTRSEHPRRVVLGLLHVWLVERVALEHPSGHRDGELGEEEDPPEVGGSVHRQRDRRMPGRGELLDRRIQTLLGLLRVSAVGEHPIVAVDIDRIAQGLVDHRDDAAPLLAGRLGHELLGPQPEALDRGGRPRT